MNGARAERPPIPASCQRAEIEAVIDALELEPIRRQGGPGRSEEQWCRTQVNCRYIHGYTYFPSPYAKLAGLDDRIEERYTVCTGSLFRDNVEGAKARSGIEDDDIYFLQFQTMEEAVAFCLDDNLAPMEIELYRRHRPISAP
ncbi:MAG: hypothetical protein JWN14_4390 [Chthonomonadales bacterium]|nr:hypothetical protein [Chthonomonadales bacterium]